VSSLKRSTLSCGPDTMTTSPTSTTVSGVAWVRTDFCPSCHADVRTAAGEFTVAVAAFVERSHAE
jgi:hypothetical protein